MKLSRKFGEDKAKQLDAPKKKGMPISYWICEKDHHVKNCPMKYNLSTMEKVEKASTIILFQVLCVVLEDKCTIIQEKYFTWLFYVPTVFNGRSIDTMVDTGANHNSMKEYVLRELGLQLEFTWTSFKWMKLEVEKVDGMTNGTTFKLRDWSGIASFSIIRMDDYEGNNSQGRWRKCLWLT